MRREGRVHPHPDDSKPTAKVDPTELKRLLGKAPPPPPRAKLRRASVGITPLYDEMVTDVMPLVIEPSLPSLALVPRGSRPKLISEKLVAIGTHHGVKVGFVLGALVAAVGFLLLG